MTNLVDVPSGFPAIDALLAFVAVRSSDATLHASGSGVLIAPGIALTAKHVLRDYSDKLDGHGNWRNSQPSSFGVQAIQYRTDGSSITWDVWSASFHEPLDIAVVQLVPRAVLHDDLLHVSARFDGAIRRVGDRVQAFGFSRTSVVWDEQRGWLHNGRPEGAVGQITQVFPESRDSASMPFPSCEMNMEVLGGMSGGPVFHENGSVCGILCSSFDFAEGRSHVSFASLIRPAASLRLRAAQNLGVWNGANATIGDLAGASDIDFKNLTAT